MFKNYKAYQKLCERLGFKPKRINPSMEIAARRIRIDLELFAGQVAIASKKRYDPYRMTFDDMHGVTLYRALSHMYTKEVLDLLQQCI